MYLRNNHMQTILLLGGFGFLGTNLMKYIDEHLLLQYRVVVFDKFDHHLHNVQFQCVTKTYAGDFSDDVLLERIFVENHIDMVVHSLSTTVPVNSFNAKYDVESNLLPTLDILAMMVKYEVKDIVYLSSGGAIYGTAAKDAHKESDDVFPVSSYGVVKLAIEKYMMQYAQLYGMRPLILRLSNPFGPYHYSMKQGVINVALDKALKGEKLEIWGNGNGRKDYIYVEDFTRILFLLLEQGVCNEVINVGSGQTYTVNEIVESIHALNPSFEWEYVDAQKFDVGEFSLNTEKLQSYIGAYPFQSLQEGLQKTQAWKML